MPWLGGDINIYIKYIIMNNFRVFSALFELPRVRTEQGRATPLPPLPLLVVIQLALECFVIKTLWTSSCIQFLIPAGPLGGGFPVDFPWSWIGTKDIPRRSRFLLLRFLSSAQGERAVGRGGLILSFCFVFSFPPNKKVFRAIKASEGNFPSGLKKEIN